MPVPRSLPSFDVIFQDSDRGLLFLYTPPQTNWRALTRFSPQNRFPLLAWRLKDVLSLDVGRYQGDLDSDRWRKVDWGIELSGKKPLSEGYPEEIVTIIENSGTIDHKFVTRRCLKSAILARRLSVNVGKVLESCLSSFLFLMVEHFY